VRRALRELRAQPPDAALVRYGQAGEWSAVLAPLTRWLEDGYVEVRRLDRPELWGIWVRRETDERCRRLTLYPYARNGARGLASIPRERGRQRNALVQRVPAARFVADLERGSFIRFAVDRASAKPEAERAVDVVAGGRRVEVWKGPADGVARRIVLPPLPDLRVEVILHAPPGRTTVWDEPVVCSPR
jgi:hypothetical protein